MQNRELETLFFDGYVIEFEGVHYEMQSIFTPTQWEYIITLAAYKANKSMFLNFLDASAELESGSLVPDMYSENIALGLASITFTPLSDELVYVEFEENKTNGTTVAYQICNKFNLDSFITWICELPITSVSTVLTYLESIRPTYKEDFEQ